MDDKEAIQRLTEELKLRKYSDKTIKKYSGVISKFLSSGKIPREFLLLHAGKSSSMMRGVYFALKFFYENALSKPFDERIPLAKKESKLPAVLDREEAQRMLEAHQTSGISWCWRFFTMRACALMRF